MKRRSFFGFLAGLAALPLLPKRAESALIADNIDHNAPIFIVRDGPTTVFTIPDNGESFIIDSSFYEIGIGSSWRPTS